MVLLHYRKFLLDAAAQPAERKHIFSSKLNRNKDSLKYCSLESKIAKINSFILFIVRHIFLKLFLVESIIFWLPTDFQNVKTYKQNFILYNFFPI